MLSLQMNQLTGTLPNEFGNMTSLGKDDEMNEENDLLSRT